jgi:hypothetical protein
MKYLVAVASLCMLAACSKHATNEPTVVEDEANHIHLDGVQSCKFGITSFNLSKRAPLTDPTANKGKPPKGSHGGGNSGGGGTTDPGTTDPPTTDPGTGGGTTPPPPPPPTSYTGVILLDFDGAQVSGTGWNSTMSTINCTPSNLSGEAVQKIIDRVTNDYAPFNVLVTTDEAVYSATDPYKRMRVILTEYYEWFGTAGGVAFVGSFTFGNNTPCFVFTSLLSYNEKKIAEATSHEAGHTFGLYHQAVYNGTTLVGNYNYGTGSGETGWAPIMGCGYNQNLTTWHNGPSSSGYNAYQDEVSMIAGVVGLRGDDHSNSTSSATALVSLATGFINSSSDVDFFSVSTSTTKTISVIPANVGTGNSGANLDLVLRIYNAQGALITTINDPSILSASTTLGAGQYYISVSTSGNQYASTYGMLDRYAIGLN